MSFDSTKSYPEILNFYTLLDPSHPLPVKPSAPEWIKQCLSLVGWTEGECIPAGLSEYIDTLLKHFDADPSPTTVTDLFRIHEVQTTLRGALKKVDELVNVEETADKRVTELFGTDNLESPFIRKLADTLREKEAEKIRAIEESAEPVESAEPNSQEAFSDTKILSLSDAAQKLESMQEPESSKEVPVVATPVTAPAVSPVVLSNTTEDDERNYLMHIVGGAEFCKTYPLWGGVASVTFKVPSVVEEDVFAKYYRAKCDNLGPSPSPLALLPVYQQARLPFVVKDVCFTGTASTLRENKRSFADCSSMSDFDQEVRKFYTEVVPSIELHQEILNSFNQHLTDLNTLRAKLRDQNFWRGETIR